MTNRNFIKFTSIVFFLLSATNSVVAILLFMPSTQTKIEHILYILEILNISISGCLLVFSMVVGFMSCFCGKAVDTFCLAGCCRKRSEEHAPFVTNPETLVYSTNGFYQLKL